MTSKSKRISMLRNSSSLFVLGAASALLTGGPAQAFDANSLPQGGTVTGGSASIATSGNTLTVNQSSNRAVIDWRSFDIGANAQANFNQPGTSSIAVNRVNASTDPSKIDGGLHANGQVWILNPNGVLFGKTAHVDAAGVVATTANIDDKAFMAGDTRLQMRGGDSGQVVNEGHITVGQGGMAAFVAPSVRNSGTIRARVGKVALAAGDTYTLDLAGDRLVEIGLGAGKAVVDQSGKIVNEGGVITISAKAAGQAVDSLINMSGVVDASSVKTAGGKIVLGADTIEVASNASLKADGTSGGTITAVADKTGNYAGSYSAQASTGDGGQIETSGKTVHIDSKIAVNTSAPKGKTGNWTLDPETLTVGDSGDGSIDSGTHVNDENQTISAGTVVAALANTNVTLQATSTITVNSAIDASVNGAAHNLTLADQDGGGLTVNLNAAITLKGASVLSGQATVVNLTNGALIQNGNDIALANSVINLNGGVYAAGATLNKSGLSLIGADGAEIDVNPGINQLNAITIGGNTDGVTVSGLVIRGEITGSYLDYAFGNGISRGVAVVNGATNFTISGNDISNVRNGILIDGRNTGSVTDNFIDNTKSAISLQYSNGSEFGHAITITGNSQGAMGNEWGLIYHLNQHLVDANTVVNNVAGAASSGVQTALLDASNANNGLSVMDRAYTLSNRTQVVVDASAALSNVDGSPRSPLTTIQSGIDAVVAGGTVNVNDGTYVVSAANGYTNGYLGIGKGLKLVGESENGVVIDARNASTYGIRVLGGTDGVSLSNFTLLGVAGTNGYGIKVENSTNFSIDHVTSQGAYKAQLDLNGVRGGTVNFVTADGRSNGVGAGSTKGAAIAITDSQAVTVSNSTVIGGAYGGIGIYQSNKPTGYTYQTDDITIDGSNTFNANGAAHYNYVYTEDESASNNFGTLTIAGFDFVAGLDANPADTFKYFQRTQQDAIDYLDSLGAVSLGYVEGWAGTAANNHFAVANASSGNAMAINPALTAASGGATITVAPGVYAETLNITKNVDITGAGIGQTIIRPTTLLATGVGHKYDANVKAAVFVNGASDVNLSGLTIDGNNLGANAVVFWNNASGSISNSLIENPQAFNGAQTGQDLAVDATGSTTSNLAVSGVQFANWNKNAIDVVTGGGSTSGGGNVTLNVSNSSFSGHGATGLNEQNGIVLWERGGSGSTVNATVDSSSFSDIAYTGTDSNATGILLYGSSAGSLTVKNSTFDNSVQKYIGTDGGASVEVDATTGNIFDGVAENGATLDQFFNMENRLADGVDNAGNSLVRLKAGQVYVTAAKNSVQNGVNAAAIGDTVNVQAGTYAGGIAINTSGVTLQGQSGTVISASGSGNAVTINGDNVTVRDLEIDLDPGANQLNGVGISGSADSATVTGLTIRGEIPDTGNHSYLDYVFGAGTSRGIFVFNGATNFSVTGNDIRNVRSGVVVDGRNTGSVANNVIDNTKGAISVQYTDGTGYDKSLPGANDVQVVISGNSQGTLGNEWGINYHLNGYWNGVAGDESHPNANPVTNGIYLANAPSAAWQQGMLDQSAANGGMTIQDQAYAASNRTAVTVSSTGSDSAQGSPKAALATIQAGVNAVVTGGTVNVNNGTYTIAGGNYINVNKSLTLIGQSEAGVIIDARNASTYGLRVTASNGPVSLSNFTLYGTTGGYGLKAEATQGLTLANITSQGAGKSEFDLNGVVGGTLTNLTADGASVATGLSTAGNGISLTDSQNIVLTGVTTQNDQWGGLALYQTNAPSGYTTQVDNITVDGTNTFNEANGIYAQDQSSLHDFGTINLAGQGIQYVAKADIGGGEGSYTWFQKTQQGAIDAAAASNVKYGVAAAAVQGYAGTGVAGNNIFTVGHATDGSALSVNTALGQSTAGGSVDVLDGAYAEDVALTAPRTVNFGNVSLNSLSEDAAAAGSVLSGHIVAGNVALNGAVVLGGDLSLNATGTVTLASADGAHDLSIASGAGASLGDLGDTTRLGAVSVSGGTTLTGTSYKAAGLDLGAVTLASDALLDATGVVNLASADGAHDLSITSGTGASLGDLGDTTRLGAVSVSGGTTLTGTSYKAASLDLGAVTLASDAVLDATGTVNLASADGAHDLAIASGAGASLGDLGDTTRLGTVSVSGGTTLTGNSYKAANLDLGAVTLASDTLLDATNAVTLASADGAHALTIASGTGASLGDLGDTTRLGAVSVSGGTTLSGSSYKTASLDLGATTLTADTLLDATNTINLASADGAHALTIASGAGASLGDLGDTARLGAVLVSGNTTLTGNSYKAASFDLGAVTLTATNTTLDTAWSSDAAGNITLNGDIFGVADGGQSLVLAAGAGSGAKSASGDISLRNAGTNAVRLGDLRVSGDNFLALTVDIAGGFTSQLAGNQVFAADTLNAGGAVDTHAAGDVSGHIVAGGDVSLDAGGAVSGNISGDALTLNSSSVGNATLQGNTLDATVSGDFNAAVNTSGNVNTNVAGNISGQIAAGGDVALNAGGAVSGNISGNALTLNSGAVSGATLQGSSLNATVAGNFNAAVNTSGNVSTNVAGNISGQIAAGGDVALNAGGLVSGNISGNALTLNSGAVSGATLAGNTVVAIVTGNFDAAVNASGSASVTGTNVSGSFTGSTVSLAGQSVNGQVNAGTLNVSAQQGAVTGTFTPGEVSSSVPLNGGVVGTNASDYFPKQLVVEGFVLPAGTQVAANGQLILPPGTVIGLLSPGGGTPRVTMVQSVQQLGELLAAGYTAIVIDLNSRKKATKLASN